MAISYVYLSYITNKWLLPQLINNCDVLVRLSERESLKLLQSKRLQFILYRVHCGY